MWIIPQGRNIHTPLLPWGKLELGLGNLIHSSSRSWQRQMSELSVSGFTAHPVAQDCLTVYWHFLTTTHSVSEEGVGKTQTTRVCSFEPRKVQVVEWHQGCGVSWNCWGWAQGFTRRGLMCGSALCCLSSAVPNAVSRNLTYHTLDTWVLLFCFLEIDTMQLQSITTAMTKWYPEAQMSGVPLWALGCESSLGKNSTGDTVLILLPVNLTVYASSAFSDPN